MNSVNLKAIRLRRRVRRVRKRISGTPERPRLAIWRSHRNIAAQIIDDTTGRTVCAISSQSEALRKELPYGGNRAAATIVGKALAQRARELGIETVCFDRRGLLYHGRIRALAEAAREAGLKF
ncbi:MAG: 50S ribosomal protein L18 [Phycisphaerae bacterium]|jgi:large subunit ribosomal protein L18